MVWTDLPGPEGVWFMHLQTSSDWNNYKQLLSGDLAVSIIQNMFIRTYYNLQFWSSQQLLIKIKFVPGDNKFLGKFEMKIF